MRVLGSTGCGPNRRANGRSRNIPCPPFERPSPSARQNRSAPSARRRGKQPFLRQNHADAKGLESGSREREGASPTCLHGSAPALQAPQRHSIRIFWRVLTEVRDRCRGRKPLLRCKPGVSPGRPLSTSQNFPSRAWEKADFRQNPPETALFAVGPSPDGGWNASGRGRRRRGSRQRGPTRAGRRRKQDRKGSVLQQNRTERGGRKTRRREKESAPPNGEPGRKSVTTRRPVPQPSIHWPSSEGEKRARPRMRYTRSIDRTRPR